MAAAAQRAACPAGRAPSPRQDSEARAPARPQDNDATSGGGSRQCAPIRAALIRAAPIFHDAAPDPGEARDFASGRDDWPSSAPSPVAKRWMRPIFACEGDRVIRSRDDRGKFRTARRSPMRRRRGGYASIFRRCAERPVDDRQRRGCEMIAVQT